MNGTEFREDGCDINSDALPDYQIEQVNQGFNSVHKAGHWLGVLHTSQTYACDDTGDMIDDNSRFRFLLGWMSSSKRVLPRFTGPSITLWIIWMIRGEIWNHV